MTDKLDRDLPKGRIRKKKTLKNFAAHTLAVTVVFVSTAVMRILWNLRAKRRTKKNVLQKSKIGKLCQQVREGCITAFCRWYGSIIILSSFLFCYLST